MLKSVLYGVALLSLASAVPAGPTDQDTSPAVKCVWYEHDYYNDLGCKSEALNERGCPSSYDCSSLAQRAADKCYYKGQSYDENAKLPKAVHPVCLAECFCGPSPALNETSLQFTCARIECPELFRGPPKEGCHRIYEHGKCCSTKEVCPTEEERSALYKCNVDGKSYFAGQKFYPQGEHCKVCICQEGYTGANVAPICEKISCDLDLHYAYEISKGCIPVYYGENSCCPIEWKCPASSVLNVHEKATAQPNTKTCKFGDLTMNVGDTATFQGSNAVCKCRVPPHPICVMPERLQAPASAPAYDILGAPQKAPAYDILGAPQKAPAYDILGAPEKPKSPTS